MITTSITATGRLLTCAALALGLSGLSVTVARAQDPEVSNSRDFDKEWTDTDTSPCTGEVIILQGKQVLTTKQKPSPTGTPSSSSKSTFFKFTSRESGSGTVENSPSRYKYSSFFENEFRTTTCKFISRIETRKKIIKLNSPQQGDDYFLHEMETNGFHLCQLVLIEREKKPRSGCK